MPFPSVQASARYFRHQRQIVFHQLPQYPTTSPTKIVSVNRHTSETYTKVVLSAMKYVVMRMTNSSINTTIECVADPTYQ